MPKEAELEDQQTATATFARTVPTLFVDSLANVARGAGTVRTYLTRFEPSLEGGNVAATQTVVAQLIMPFQGFAALSVTFEAHLKGMLQNGEVSAEFVEGIRKQMGLT
jgi:hypothetical protein